MANQNAFPTFLQSYENLKQHIDAELESLSSFDKGVLFSDFALALAPRTMFGHDVEEFDKTQLSHDEGIDIIGVNTQKHKKLYIQAKLTINKKDLFDNVISKFQNYYERLKSPKQPLKPKKPKLSDRPDEPNLDGVYFQIITLSQLATIVDLYKNSSLGSRDFYEQLQNENRLEIIDGPKILKLLQDEYRKFMPPSTFSLRLETPIIEFEQVKIGILSSKTLKELYNEYKDALFIENFREYLGISNSETNDGRRNINQDITSTIVQVPDQLLARNNGLTIKAKQIKAQDSQTLLLTEASIINGCQTTMCIVHHAESPCFVLAKIVQADEDSTWDVVRSTNLQNELDEIDLDLARFLRPQIIAKYSLGFNVRLRRSSEDITAFEMLSTLYKNEITYDEIKSLFIGLFSFKPNNIFEHNYLQLHLDLLHQIFHKDMQGKKLFEQLILLQNHLNQGLTNLETRLTERREKMAITKIRKNRNTVMKRDEEQNELLNSYKVIRDKNTYRAFLGLLAVSATCDTDLSQKGNTLEEKYNFTMELLDSITWMLENHPEEYHRYCRYAFFALQEQIKPQRNADSIRRRIHNDISKANFTTLLQRVQTASTISD